MREKSLVNTHIHFAVCYFLSTCYFYNLYLCEFSDVVRMGTEGDLATPEFEDFKKGAEGKIENILTIRTLPWI